MKGYYDNEGYYRKLIELQEKLRRSEEERMKLEEKFNKMIQHKREEEQIELQRLKRQYNKFLEEEKFRSERNDQIIRALDRIEYKAAMLTAKTDRLRILRGQYETCIKRSLTWNSNNNNNVKPTFQQITRDISYGDTQQLRPTSLNIGKANPFPSKFIHPSVSNDGANNSSQYLNLDISNEQNINKPTSTSFFNKQNTPINYVTSNFDNNYGKNSSRFTPNVVQENSGIIRGNLPIRNPLNQFSENEFSQIDGRTSTYENANNFYPSIYSKKNDTENPTYEMEKTQLRTEVFAPHRETCAKSDNTINLQVESSNQSLPRKVDFISTIPKTQHDTQQLSQKLANPKLNEFNTDNISGLYPPDSEKGTKIKSEIENKIKPATCYIVDDEHNDAEDVRILNNAYDGYYVDDESEQIYEPQKQKEPEKPSQPMAPSSTLDKKIKEPSSIHANQVSNIQSHIYQESSPQEIIDEQSSNNKVIVKTSTEPTENMVQLTKGNSLATDKPNEKPLTSQGYETSKTSENNVPTLAENSMNNNDKQSLEYTNVNPESNVYSENTNHENINYEAENNNYDDQQLNNIQAEFEQPQANNYENGNINYETHDPETINQSEAEEYKNYNETLNNAESVENPDETQIQENYEPDVNPGIGQSQEGYENYKPGINSDTALAQGGYENYNPGVNINQMPEVYGNYDGSQDAMGQDSTLQYEGYDSTQAQFDPNNPDGYDNTQQQFDPNNPEAYGNNQEQYDTNNSGGYENTQQQFDPSNPEVYNNSQEQYDANNPEAYDNSQEQYDPNNPVAYDNNQEQYDTNNLQAFDNTQQQFDPNNPEAYVNSQEQYDPNNAIYNETNQISNMEPSQIYNEESVVDDNTSTVQYTDDNQMYYTENQEYSQRGVYDPNVAQEDGNYQNILQDGAYQQDGNEYPTTNMPQDAVYQDEAYQDNVYSEEGQMNYTVESNNIQDQEIVEQENYLINDSNQPQINLQNEPSVEKLTSNLSTLLDSDTSEQQSSDQQQVASVRDESDFDFSESAAT